MKSVLSAYSSRCVHIQVRQRPRAWTYLQQRPVIWSHRTPQESCDCSKQIHRLITSVYEPPAALGREGGGGVWRLDPDTDTLPYSQLESDLDFNWVFKGW
jgi:hypothetical protein